MSDILRVAVVYPDLLGTYGDGGNGLILSRRAQWRGYESELVQAVSDHPLPEADVYCLGGGEDGPQVRAAHLLLEDGTLARKVSGGAVVLAVCAGYQIVGECFPGVDGTPHEGVGLLGVETVKGTEPRAVGEVLVEPTGLPIASPVAADAHNAPAAHDGAGGADGAVFPVLSGFENHGGRTSIRRDDGTVALGRVLVGVGNGDGDRSEGAVCGHVVGTYLHGPVLARNPALADLLLSWALAGAPLGPVDDAAAESLRAERLAAVGGRRRRWRRHRG